jgi:cyclopropane fatty-acyl-phospholipid synthase-like methyltransferase
MCKNSPGKSLQPEYFEGVYGANEDPWNFETSEYEAAKYAATIESLPKEKYESGFEIGCSIGVLTEKLAARCAKVLSVDVNETALAKARKRCADLAHVEFGKMQIPGEFPAENFDLIVVSEVGYYLSVEDWQMAQSKILNHLKPNGTVILVHWTHSVDDYPQTGDDIHESFAATAKSDLKLIKSARTKDYRLDVWEK